MTARPPASNSRSALPRDLAGHRARRQLSFQEIDLLSVPTHEFGQVLGYDHDLMGDMLAVGERDLPLEDEMALVEDNSPFGPDLDSDVLVG